MITLLPLDIPPSTSDTVAPILIVALVVLAVALGLVVLIRHLRRRR